MFFSIENPLKKKKTCISIEITKDIGGNKINLIILFKIFKKLVTDYLKFSFLFSSEFFFFDKCKNRFSASRAAALLRRLT